MTVDEVLKHYGSIYRFCKDTGMSHNSYYNWRERGYVPIVSQMKIERLTEGALVANTKHTVGNDT